MEQHVQLQINFEGLDDDVNNIYIDSLPEEKVTDSKPEPCKTQKCKHSIRIKSFKKDYLSYCSKCGKIFSVKHKKGE